MSLKEVNKPNVLLIDDESINLIAFRASHRQKLNIFLAQNKSDAIKILYNEDINVVISDQKMPEITGVELLAEIAGLFPRIKRYILSGFIDHPEVLAAMETGVVQEYFTKPYDFEEFQNKIYADMQN